jgi:hypothetical protein
MAANTNEYISPLCFAFAHLGLSHASESLDAIEAAAEQRLGPLIWLSIDPRFDALRAEPRFQSVRTKMGLSASNARNTIG